MDILENNLRQFDPSRMFYLASPKQEMNIIGMSGIIWPISTHIN